MYPATPHGSSPSNHSASWEDLYRQWGDSVLLAGAGPARLTQGDSDLGDIPPGVYDLSVVTY
jgi:hypothetical protein